MLLISGESNAKEGSKFHETAILGVGTTERDKNTTGFLLTSRSPSSEKFEKVMLDNFASEGNTSDSPANDGKDLIVNNMTHEFSERSACHSPASEIPPETTSCGGCSKDWCFTPGDDRGSIKQRQKLKRLRRVGEGDSHAYLKCQKNFVSPLDVQNNQSQGNLRIYAFGL